jgi:hypothetical protein
MKQNECPLYKKHHNTIDGIYMNRRPRTWDEIPLIDKIDIEDDGELYAMFIDLKIYDIETIQGFENPTNKHNINETIFIIRRNGKYYLCETQGENYIKFSTEITNVDFVKMYDRLDKILKLYENINKHN